MRIEPTSEAVLPEMPGSRQLQFVTAAMTGECLGGRGRVSKRNSDYSRVQERMAVWINEPPTVSDFPSVVEP